MIQRTSLMRLKPPKSESTYIDLLKSPKAMLTKTEWSLWGEADGPVVKVLDSQPRDRGFESRHTLGLLCLKSLAKICTLNVP